MELRQLEYLVAVAEEASFTKAAARVHVAQPGISAQIRRLERELGHELFDRSGRAVKLTEVGAAVLPHARAALTSVEGVRSAVEELTGLLRGQVSVGTVTSYASPDVPGLLADFHRAHPAVEINLSEDHTSRLVEGLRSGELDLAFIGLGAKAPAGIDVEVVVDEPLVAMVSHDDELAAKRSIPLKALADRALISLPKGTALRSILDDACAAAGFDPRIAFEASDPGTLARLAARGLGVAVLPSSITESRAKLHALAVTGPALRGRLAMAWRREGPSSPAAQALLAQAKAMVASSAEG